jgi:hypothetical protein
MTKEVNMLSSFSMDIETGKWHRNLGKEEHPSTAVPKLVHQITERTKIIISNIEKAIQSSITEIYEHKAKIIQFQNKMREATQEISTEIKVMNSFTEKVMQLVRIEHCDNIKGQPSARTQLQRAGDNTAFSVENSDFTTQELNFKRLVEAKSIAQLHERVNNHDALNLLEASKKRLEKIQHALPRIEMCWNEMTSLDVQNDPEKLLEILTDLKNRMRFLKNDEILDGVYQSFFHIEDATIGLLHLDEAHSAEFDPNQATLKLIKVVQRTYLKGLEYFHKSDEKVLATKALELIATYNVNKIELKHIDALCGIPDLIGIEPGKNPSPEHCYRKFGDLHSNLRQKRFELLGLMYLEEYFPEKLRDLSVQLRALINQVHHAFIQAHTVTQEQKKIHRTNISEENIQELEVSARLLENSLLQTEPGKEYFAIAKKLHEANQSISSRYNHPDLESLDRCTEILDSELFSNFVTSLTELMLGLREEQKLHPNTQVNPKDLKLIGIVTGKTNNMINTYVASIEEILAPLSTFMGNTLHALLQEMLRNTPLADELSRKRIKKAYKLTGSLLRNLDQRMLSNSGIYKAK